MAQHSPNGSLWSRWDLHFHTPSSFDYANRAASDQQIVDKLLAERVRVVAVTDHHVMDVARIRSLQALGAAGLTVLPGIELRDDHGKRPVNYVCIFPEDCDLDHVWTTLQGRLKLTPNAVRTAGGDERVYVPIEDGAKVARELGGVVTIHAGAKSNSIEGIGNYEQFQQRVKYDITNQWVDILEIGQLKDIERYLHKVFPSIGLDRPLILCSDNHDIASYAVRAVQWFRADPTFRGLLMVLREPRDRVFIGSIPPEVVRVQQAPTKYIRSVSYERRSSAPPTEQWFEGTIPFSTGLVAIIGNKGSGKSALADTLGLLGGTKNEGAFSFLSKERFRHPSNGFAGCFDACLTWESGEIVQKGLSEPVGSEEVERIKYLPQDHVERMCNALPATGVEAFEQELKAVIFSHVPDAQRLGNATLDDLVRFQNGEKQKRIDSLLKQLREVGRARALLEAQENPTERNRLLERIKRRKAELEAHERAKPAAVADPASADSQAQANDSVLVALGEAEAERKRLREEASRIEGTLHSAERQGALANRLLEKLSNFRKDYDSFLPTLEDDANELGLDSAALVSLSLDQKPVEAKRDLAAKNISTLTDQLEGVEPPGLRSQVAELDEKILNLRASLDAPNRAYQTYLSSLSGWEDKRQELVGTEAAPESLEGLNAALSALDDLPAQLRALKERQLDLALSIHSEKLAQADVYRTLYRSVQSFIDSHPLARDKLKLEFRVEIAAEDFAGRLLALLALNRRGSFMGVEDGRARAQSLLDATHWDDAASVKTFLDDVDEALHRDLRDKAGPSLQLGDQLAKNRKSEEVFDLLYGLEYLQPRYILRWDGKDLSMLSPGERGTLLLVFYLLIDKSDIPLVIDQPEGNLDNHTVAKVLVECIKEARRRRQVFIVTHNPNLAVVCDADQVVHASMDKSHGNVISYATGALENPRMTEYVTDVLEGTRWAFGVRGDKYAVTLGQEPRRWPRSAAGDSPAPGR